LTINFGAGDRISEVTFGKSQNTNTENWERRCHIDVADPAYGLRRNGNTVLTTDDEQSS
jgi:hypothetical protein